MEILPFIILWFVVFLIESAVLEKKKQKILTELEANFLMSTVHFEQYKYQMLQIMELVYEKAAETDPQFKKDYEKIKASICQKCDDAGDNWIKYIQSVLNKKTDYNNWIEATKYTEGILKKSRENVNGRKDT